MMDVSVNSGRHSFAVLLAAALLAAAGCASELATKESIPDLHPVAVTGGRLQMNVQPCINRTGYTTRDLGKEATEALIEKIGATTELEISATGRYIVTCDILTFVEGSAFKRWVAPGWGATTSQVAVMVTDSSTRETVAIVRGQATVSGGGLYSAGADQIILASALDDVVKQLRQLAVGIR